jgi:hypothetical protein
MPFDASELSVSKIHDIQISIDESNKDLLFVMEGKDLNKLDLKTLTLHGKSTLNLFSHFIYGRP